MKGSNRGEFKELILPHRCSTDGKAYSVEIGDELSNNTVV